MSIPDNPWQTLHSKNIYKNNWIQVTEHQVINPAGNPGIYGTVNYQNDAVGIVPYEDGHIWMVSQFRFPLNQRTWEIPEGGNPLGTDPFETAVRELKEETGLVAENWETLFEMHLSNSVSDEWGIVYLATGLSQGESELEETEDIIIKKMPLDLVYEEVEARRITDSMTVAAIYKLMLWKATGRLP